MSSLLHDATPYGIKALRQMRDKRLPTKRYTKQISQTYDYFLEKVDPIVGACITHLLCDQPPDILVAMKAFLAAKKANINIESKVGDHNAHHPRKELKVFLATNIGPIISKLVNRIAIERPENVLDFMTAELEKMIAGEDEVTVEIKVKTPELKVVETKADFEKSNTLQIAVLGLGGGGKSTLLNQMQGKFDSKTKPTIGFRPISMMLSENTKIRFYDLGGGKKIRDIWNQYYHDVHAVLYVVDGSTKAEDMEECVRVFKSTIASEYLIDKPLLVLTNKQDLEGAIPAAQWADILKTQGNVHFADVSCPPAPEAAEEVTADPRIETALEWLLHQAMEGFDVLNERVKIDSQKKSAEEAAKRVAKERKVLKNKIASAFIETASPEYIAGMQIEAEPSNVFSKQDGLEYMASEIGEDVPGLSDIARKVAAGVGYQKLALLIIGGLKAPVSKKKTPMDWDEIYALVESLRRELGL
jgi:ADP-ribosylation factor-like protein 13B